MKPLYLLAVAAVVFAGAARAAGPACSAYTGPHTTALVELYTSEGCDTCPPADHWLSSLFSQGFRPEQVVPLSPVAGHGQDPDASGQVGRGTLSTGVVLKKRRC